MKLNPSQMLFGQRENDYVSQETFESHKHHYTVFFDNVTELLSATQDHDCRKTQLLKNDYIPFVGFHCTGCNQGWGIHVRDLTKSLKSASPEVVKAIKSTSWFVK